MPEYPKFTAEKYDQIKRASGCSDDICNVNYIINKPVVSVSDGGGCCDCPPGPQGPPAPAGAEGPAGSGSCGKVYAGPLKPANTGPIDEKAFQDLLSSKGYIVRLETANQQYAQESMDADVTIYPNGSLSYIDPTSGSIVSGPISNEKDFYPIAYKSTGTLGTDQYNHNPTFGEFLEMCGLRDSQTGTPENRKDFYKTTTRSQIPSLMRTRNDATLSREYTFISSDSSAKEGSNGPYLTQKFSDTVSGIISGAITSNDYTSDNPAVLTNLGHQIVKENGSIGVAYDCETCIQGPPDSNRLTDSTSLSQCDVFVDTDNGVMYTRDESTPDGNWPGTGGGGAGVPRFNQNGIPLRRQPKIPEFIPKPKTDVFMAHIVNYEQIADFRWKYTFSRVLGMDPVAQNEYLISAAPVAGEFAFNGAEARNLIDGVGDNVFEFFTGIAQMLPIENGTIVMMKKIGTSFHFSVPNAYKVRCE